MNLELMAMRWLWLEKKCHYILEQRTPLFFAGQPDVIGVTHSRKITEIEIKRSYSDFMADFKKRHRMNREHFLESQPSQFYYLVPKDLVEKVLPKLPSWAGLMTNDVNEVSISVVKTAPVNKLAKKLSIKDCIKMTRMMVAHTMSVRYAAASMIRRFESGAIEPWYWSRDSSAGHYEI